MSSNCNNAVLISACSLFGISTDLSLISLDDLKRKYHRLALQWHPDKNNDSEQSIQRFQDIQHAYEYLQEQFLAECVKDDNEVKVDENNGELPLYTDILMSLLQSLFGADAIYLCRIVRDILSSPEITTPLLRTLLQDLSKERTLFIYNVCNQYKDVLHISSSMLEMLTIILQEKSKQDQMFILKPTLRELMSDSIYCLQDSDSGETYFVPLWQKDMVFESKKQKGKEVIVICDHTCETTQPLVQVDENNHIYYHLVLRWSDLPFQSDAVSIDIGGHAFSIPLSHLRIVPEQCYVFLGQGILTPLPPNSNETKAKVKDMYSAKERSNVYVTVQFI